MFNFYDLIHQRLQDIFLSGEKTVIHENVKFLVGIFFICSIIGLLVVYFYKHDKLSKRSMLYLMVKFNMILPFFLFYALLFESAQTYYSNEIQKDTHTFYRIIFTTYEYEKNKNQGISDKVFNEQFLNNFLFFIIDFSHKLYDKITLAYISSGLDVFNKQKLVSNSLQNVNWNEVEKEHAKYIYSYFSKNRLIYSVVLFLIIVTVPLDYYFFIRKKATQ